MSIEAMKLALEALEDCVSDDITPYQLTKAITVLRQAIAEAEQAEPIGYIASMALNDLKDSIYGEVTVYPSDDCDDLIAIYTTPPQRKPLTDEQVFCIWRRHTDLDAVRHTPDEDDGLSFTRAIEAAHGIKENT